MPNRKQKKVKIWNDNWISGVSNAKVVSSNGQLDREALVEDLIDVKRKQWRRYLIFVCFNDYEEKMFMSIPLSFKLPEEKRLWFHEKDDIYSVKSSYHHTGGEKCRVNIEASTGGDYKLWKGIWNVKLPNTD